jgi:anti-sigma regulatory factor (Ser/Thr protein kinase)
LDSSQTTPIELALPGDSRFMRLARLVASGVATTCGLPLEEVEDFRVAVDEICATLIEAGGGEPIRLMFVTNGGTLRVTGTTSDVDQRGPDEDRLALSRQILDVISESHRFARVDGHVEFTVVTRLRGGGVG